MRNGSEEHGRLFCRTLVEGHKNHEPADLPWPELSEAEPSFLRCLPFGTHALQFESNAGPPIRSVAGLENDLLIGDAPDLQADEEERYPRLVRHMLAPRDLPHEEAHGEPSFDRRLIVPTLFPALARAARLVLRSLPERGFSSSSKGSGPATSSSEQAPRAA
jgi:hypothetical protein